MRAGAACPRMPISISAPTALVVRRNVSHADIFLQKRRGAAAGDASSFVPADEHRVTVAPDALIEHLEADKLARQPRLFLLREDVAPEKWGLFQFADPAKSRFPRRGGLVNFMAVEAHACFEAQSIARAEAAGNHAGGFSSLHQIVPEFFRMFRSEIDFKSIFAGVAGARDQAINAAHLAEGEMIVADVVERRWRELLQDFGRARALNRELRIARAGVFNRRVEAIVGDDVLRNRRPDFRR